MFLPSVIVACWEGFCHGLAVSESAGDANTHTFAKYANIWGTRADRLPPAGDAKAHIFGTNANEGGSLGSSD